MYIYKGLECEAMLLGGWVSMFGKKSNAFISTLDHFTLEG
jgi:hypothetical protein